MAVRIAHRIAVEDPVELLPLGVLARAQDGEGHRFEPLEGLNFQCQLLQGFGRGCSGGNLFLKIVHLVLAVFVEVSQYFVEVPQFLAAGSGAPESRGCTPCGKSALGKLVLQTRAAALQRPVDGRRAGCETALQDLQGKAHVVTFLRVVGGEALHPVHFLAHVAGDGRVKFRLLRGELVLCGIGAAFGEKRAAVEAEQRLLGQPAHHVPGIGKMRAVAEAPLEAVPV